MIQDMYEDEYYVSLIRNKHHPSIDNALFYRYYSDLNDQELETYNVEEIDPQFTKERGNLLGVSIPALNSWVSGNKEEI